MATKNYEEMAAHNYQRLQEIILEKSQLPQEEAEKFFKDLNQAFDAGMKLQEFEIKVPKGISPGILSHIFVNFALRLGNNHAAGIQTSKEIFGDEHPGT